MPDQSGAVNLGEAKTEATEPHIETEDSSPDKVITAFLVVMTREGEVVVAAYDGDDLALDVNPTTDLIHSAASVIQKDMIAQETAKHTVELQMRQAVAMQERMQHDQIARRMQQGVGPHA